MITLKHNKLQKEITISSFGRSMYGGWYANYHYIDGEKIHHDGFHADTLKELCTKAELSKTEMQHDVTRWDN